MANNSKEAVRTEERQKRMKEAVDILAKKNKKALKEAEEAASGCWSTVLGIAVVATTMLLLFL